LQTTIPRSRWLNQFRHKKYLGLETYRKNGQPVLTPVWFITDESHIYVNTDGNSGKVERILKNHHVRVVPITPRGKPDGEWIVGEARIVNVPSSEQVKELMDRKYGRLNRGIAWLYGLVTGRPASADRVVISIQAREGGEHSNVTA